MIIIDRFMAAVEPSLGMALFFMDSQDIRKEVRPDRIGISRNILSAKFGVVPRSRPKKVKSKFWIWLTKSPPMDENAAGFCATALMTLISLLYRLIPPSPSTLWAMETALEMVAASMRSRWVRGL